MNKNRLLTEEAKLEAKLLNEAWLSFKKQNPNFTQEELAHRCGWKTQGAVSQYLHGRIPLNATALSRISKVLGVKPESISMRLANELAPFETGAPIRPVSVSPEAAKLIRAIEQLDHSFDDKAPLKSLTKLVSQLGKASSKLNLAVETKDFAGKPPKTTEASGKTKDAKKSVPNKVGD